MSGAGTLADTVGGICGVGVEGTGGTTAFTSVFFAATESFCWMRRVSSFCRSAVTKVYSPVISRSWQARHLVTMDIKGAKLPHPNAVPCVDCGHIGPDRRHEYDHHQGYSVEHMQNVQARCVPCHRKRHAELKETCINGHPFTGENIKRVGSRRVRTCLICRRERDRGRRDAAFWREYRLKKKEKNV